MLTARLLVLVAATSLCAACAGTTKCVVVDPKPGADSVAASATAASEAEPAGVAWDEQDAEPAGPTLGGLASGVEVVEGNPPRSHCGSPDARDAFSSLEGWAGYLCRDAAEDEAGCYPRHAYTGGLGRGCPGAQLCCQAATDCATSWECRELGWCTLRADQCVASDEAACQASARCSAIGTCTFAIGGEGIGDCCTAAEGGYCNANEVRFEAAEAAAKRARKCQTPPPFQGARTPTDAYDVTGDAVAAGTTRSFGFGDTILASRGEGGAELYVLHGRDACGLWVERQSAASGVFDVQRLRRSRWLKLTPSEEDGSFSLRKLGVRLTLRQAAPGTFDVELLTRIREYEGE